MCYEEAVALNERHSLTLGTSYHVSANPAIHRTSD